MIQSQNGNHGACQLKRQKVGTSVAQTKRVGVIVLLLTGRRMCTPPYLVASRNRLQTRSCWGGWSCSPLHLIQDCKDGRRTIRMGWTWEQDRRAVNRAVSVMRSEKKQDLYLPLSSWTAFPQDESPNLIYSCSYFRVPPLVWSNKTFKLQSPQRKKKLKQDQEVFFRPLGAA